VDVFVECIRTEIFLDIDSEHVFHGGCPLSSLENPRIAAGEIPDVVVVEGPVNCDAGTADCLFSPPFQTEDGGLGVIENPSDGWMRIEVGEQKVIMEATVFSNTEIISVFPGGENTITSRSFDIIRRRAGQICRLVSTKIFFL
jgi:hypothetical protein